MKVEIQNDEQITVQYYPAHYGHSNLSHAEETHLSENSMTIGGMNGNSSSSNLINGHQHSQQDHGQTLTTHYPSNNGDRSSSSSPGSSSTSPLGGSNSNANYPPPSSLISLSDRQSMIMPNTPIKTMHSNSNHHNLLQNHMSHCIIISPSFVVEENLPSHSNHQSTPVLVIQQQQQPQQQYMNHHFSSSPTALIAPPTSLVVKKEKSVSDIMRESFELLSYWPLDQQHGLVTPENEQQIPHSHVNMDEHLMF